MDTLSEEDTVKLEAQRVRVALQEFGEDDIAHSLRVLYVTLPEDNPQAWTELRRLCFALRHN